MTRAHLGLQSLLLGVACCLTLGRASADPLCDGSGTQTVPACSGPVLADWDTWRIVFPTAASSRLGSARPSEAEAIQEAVAALGKAYPCGLSYALVDAPYVESAKTLDWTAKEDSPRISYVGFPSGPNGNCQARTLESNGVVSIRRERKVRCARGYGWLIRDGQPAVCIKD